MITVRFSTSTSEARQQVFLRAGEVWDRVLNTAFEPVEVDGEALDGLVIDAAVEPIDGPEGTLGQAGPTVLRPGSELPVKGIMQFDEADITRLEEEGSFADVILHEMAHVLGFGTLWARQGLIAGSGTMDPRFIGEGAVREYGGLSGDEGAVPIANTGGAGTREGHWRELVFGDELLTGFLSGEDRPLSRMSVASFADLGYKVDLAAADAFDLPSFRELALMGITEAVRTCTLCKVSRPIPMVLGAP
ncbi:hypothetical protein AAD018_018215 [Aestuariibius insulae]|uniref:hypothetical protein n=1 Tax=Aestuariibius insulae TaxID=2058287 RepID=UPI00345E7B4F